MIFTALLQECAAFVVCFLYSSFFEWFGHRYVMHVRRFPLQFVYQGHTHVHHLHYRGHSFEAKEDVVWRDLALRWFSFPAILLVHAPVMLLLQRVTHASIFIGCVAAAALYYAGFEYTHYLMHRPRQHWIERWGWFDLLREHHRLHHEYMRRNFNVLLPLADFCLGTLMTRAEWTARTRAVVETSISGAAVPETAAVETAEAG